MSIRSSKSLRRLSVAALGLVVVVAAGCGGGGRGGRADDEADGTAVEQADVGQAEAEAEVRLLAIGDSVLDFSDEESTPERVGVALEAQGVSAVVVNRAVGGTCLASCGREDRRIPAQYEDGDWTHVLISGGGNDLGELDEACRSPEPLMSADLQSGAMVDLVDRVPAGTVVLLYRYSSAVPQSGLCPEISTLMERYAAFADERPDVVLVDANIVSGPDTPDLWADDVHPNEAGSDVIGRLIADLIVDLDAE